MRLFMTWFLVSLGYHSIRTTVAYLREEFMLFYDKILFVEACSISLVVVSYGGMKISWRSLKCSHVEIKSLLTTTTKIASTYMFAKVAQEYCLYHPNISIVGKVVLLLLCSSYHTLTTQTP